MAVPPPPALTIKTASEIRDDQLRVIKNGLIQLQGATNPNVTVDSDFGLIATGLGNEVAIASNNAPLMGQQLMGDTATGADLDRILNYYGLQRRPASEAIGSVIVTSSASTLVAAGEQLQSSQGERYQVLTTGTYGNGSAIKVVSLDTGSDTNQAADTVLTWVAPPPYFAPTVTVSEIDPVSGGIDAEDDETARARFNAFLANPPGGGNPTQIIGWAQEADPEVQYAFVSPAARGPATVDVCVVGYATSSSKNRDLDSSLVINTVSPFVLGELPQFADGYVCTVSNYPIDVAISLSLPDPVTANPSGTGGGFLDPSPLQVTTAKPAIRIVDGYAISGSTSGVPQNTSTSFWIDCPIAPTSGVVYNISYLSPVDWNLYSGQTNGTLQAATSFPSLSSHTSLYYITVNVPFYQASAVNQIVQPGNWIFPTAVNTPVYVAAYLDYLSKVGPGERTTDPGLLPRAYRQPRENVSWNYKLNNRLLKPIVESGEEVFDGSILFRGSSGTTDSSPFTDYGSLTLNGDPAYALYAPPTAYLNNGTALGPSYIFVPHNFGIYRES